MRKKLFAIVAVLLLLLSVASVAFAAKSYRAERFDADWHVDQDGALTISETVVFVFSGGPFTYVYRELPDDYSDGIEVLSVWMDGRQLAAGSGPGQYEIEGRGETEITWHFNPTSDSEHIFQLTYRVLGAVRREGGQDLLVWNFLPTDYDYAIDSATLRVAYPAPARRVGPPEVRRGQATIQEGDGQAIFSASGIRRNSPLTVALRFEEDSLITEPPSWQRSAVQVAQRAPTMWLLAALMLAVGTIFLAQAWRSGLRESGAIREPRAITQSVPPSDLSPALAGALLSTDGKPGMVQAVATLFGLAQRGVLTFEEISEKKWYRSQQFNIRLQPGTLNSVRLEPHEEALVAGLFTGKGRDEVKLTDLARHLRVPMKEFAKSVESQLVERGLLDPARAAHANRLVVIGLALLALMVLSLIAAALLARAYGGWVLLIPLAVFILSMVAFAMSAVYSRRSATGEQAAVAWKGFRDYLRGVTKGREPSWDMRMFDRYFPYAASFDLAEGWAKAFRERGGVEPPAWFRSLSADGVDNMAAFIVLTSASHSSAASGGAGAGGAGGGGGSGAG